MVLNLDETYAIQCFAVVGEQAVAGGFTNGLVLGRTAPFSVILASFDDRDHDGVPDNEDECPDKPEDEDKVADSDGCPETDADSDGVPDFPDGCPEIAGRVTTTAARTPMSTATACPTTKINARRCRKIKTAWPTVTAARNTTRMATISAMRMTSAPTIRKTSTTSRTATAGFDPDNDSDRIYDAQDDCPDEPENYNGFLDDDGCFDRWPTYTFAGSIPEAAVSGDGDRFSITTAFNVVVDINSGAVTGTFNGTGPAEVPFTCFNVDDDSEIYDDAKVDLHA